MHEKHLETLEFHKILDRLAAHTTFSAGEVLALALRPSTDPVEIDIWQRETTEACRVLNTRGGVPLGGIHDVRPLVANTLKGIVLTPEELLDVHDTLVRGRSLRRSLGRMGSEVPLLASTALLIEECAHVIAEIARCINDRAEVMDGASPELARIRQGLTVAHDRLMERLRRILTSPDYAGYLQESIITQRHGRYVVPLKSDFKGRIPGLIHDESSSGATLFIEPLATVELNNALRELQLAEQREVTRILGNLSSLVADEGDFITRTVEILAQLDLAFAKARYSFEIRAVQPEFVNWHRPTPLPASQSSTEPPPQATMHPGSTIRLRKARHPLLPADEVVPINVYLSAEDGFFIIVVTGPNTGGKTVSLKTVGLLTCMAQAGLHIPAEDGSGLSVFDAIFADIGDEQSIEQSLSTFSSHLVNIVNILKEADRQSMVLLDELGAGTDPVEGSALARSVLSFLARQSVTALATTHYSDLKVYAHTTPGVINASVEFNVETLSPTYELNIGLPGRSNAFAIARRLGLPAHIIEQAQAMLSPGTLQAEGLLTNLKETQSQAMADMALAKDLRHKLEEQNEELRQRLLKIEQEREDILDTARREVQQELEAVRREIARVRENLQNSSDQAQSLAEAAQVISGFQTRLAKPQSKPLVEQLPLEQVAVGDVVWVPGLDSKGEVVNVSSQGVEVQVGHFRVQADLRKVRRMAGETAHQPLIEDRPVRVITHRQPGLTTIEVDLRGQRVEEALTQLERYLDDAYLGSLPWVRIIHGRGTGALRRAVRETLAMHPLVASFRSGEMNEGGDGVTFVEFARK